MITARFNSRCSGCKQPLAVHESLLVRHDNTWRCPHCVFGLSDEDAREKAHRLA